MVEGGGLSRTTVFIAISEHVQVTGVVFLSRCSVDVVRAMYEPLQAMLSYLKGLLTFYSCR